MGVAGIRCDLCFCPCCLAFILLLRFLTITVSGNKLLRMLEAVLGIELQIDCLRNFSFSHSIRVF
jgi:hypothetical protein